MKKPLLVALIGLLPLLWAITHVYAQVPPELSADEVMQLARENVDRYRKSDVLISLVDEQGKAVKGAALEIHQTSQDFLFGALAFDLVWERFEPEKEALFKERFSEVFNFAILPFYWGAYEAKAGHPQWNRIDPVLDWCLENGITCKGHPLAWTHEVGLPAYVRELSLEESEILLHSRIIENVTGFKDRITLWDVVNEPVNTVNWEMAHSDVSPTNQNRYRTDIPIEELAGWVEKAYKTAYIANPDNQYILNEFKLIADPEIRQRFYDFTQVLLDRQTPIHGLGIQAHEPREDWFDPVEVWKTLELYSEFDLPLHITEFIPQSGGAAITGGFMSGNWTPDTQAECAEMMYRLWFGHPSVVSINWWAFSDANSWLPGGGFLTEEMQPKPAFEVLNKLIKEEWLSPDTHSETNQKGEYEFRGFHGEYEVVASLEDGTRKNFTFHLEKESSEKQLVRLEL
jgi:GH35 family endo-1,4-beta-xylanase